MVIVNSSEEAHYSTSLDDLVMVRVISARFRDT